MKLLDGSRYQVSLDPDVAALAGIDFIVWRATVGDYYTDPTFTSTWRKLANAPVARGAYHVVRPDCTVHGQIDLLFRALGDTIPDLPVVLDCEVKRKNNSELFTSAEVIRSVQACALHVSYITRTRNWPVKKQKPIIYTNPDYANSFLQNAPFLSDYDLWVAHYTTSQPVVPRPWLMWVFHQYTDRGSGKDFGVGSRFVDLSHTDPTINIYGRYGISLAEPPEPQPPPPSEPPTPELVFPYVVVLVNKLNKRDKPWGEILGWGEKGDKFEVKDIVVRNCEVWVQSVDDSWSAYQVGNAQYLDLILR